MWLVLFLWGCTPDAPPAPDEAPEADVPEDAPASDAPDGADEPDEDAADGEAATSDDAAPTQPLAGFTDVLFTPDEMRAALPVGTELTFRETQLGAPTRIQVMTVVGQKPGGIDARWASVPADDPDADPEIYEQLYPWSQLAPGRLLRAEVEIVEETFTTALGTFDGVRYRKQVPGLQGTPQTSTNWFATDIPGPAVLVTGVIAEGPDAGQEIYRREMTARELPGG